MANAREQKDLSFTDLTRMITSLGRGSPTSLQRVFPLSMPGRVDASKQPLDGDYTDSLFLSTRNEAQIQGEHNRKQRRLLESLSATGRLDSEMLEQLEDLKVAEGAESDTSEIETNNMYYIDEHGKQTKWGSGNLETADDGSRCGEQCPLRLWAIEGQGPTTIVEAECIKKSRSSTRHSLYGDLATRQIRMLQVFRGTTSMPIITKLHVIDLDSAKTSQGAATTISSENVSTYEALSYCWGPPNLNRSILCNGALFKVTQNLFSALSHLRRKDGSRFLWIDAICINQTDTSERSGQVRHMLEIYQKASRVVIWLGDVSPADGSNAIDFMDIMESPQYVNLLGKRVHNNACRANWQSIADSLNRFYAQPWFGRTWIRQELAAGRKIIVQCGNRDVPWHMLKRAAKRLERMDLEFEDTTEAITKFRKSPTLKLLSRSWVYGQSVLENVSVAGSWYYWHGGGLLDLLLVSGDFDATDPRDRVYAILGLAREFVEGGINIDALWPYTSTDPGDRVFQPMLVDYTQSLRQVYSRLAKHVINRDLNLDILCALALIPRSILSVDLPTWTPDWRSSRDMDQWDFLAQKFEATGFARAEYQDIENEDQLKVKGYEVTEILSLLDITAKIWDLMFENGEAIIKSQGALENRTEWRGLPVFEPLEDQHTRRCCMTNNGRVALVPKDARVGDGIFVLLGARVPFVLRSCDGIVDERFPVEEGRLFKIVGPCCLPGHMQGEVFTEVRDREALDLTLV